MRPTDRRAHLERKHRRTGEQRDRQQQVQHHDRPAQIARDREQADRRLRERAEEDPERKPRCPARQSRRAANREPGEQRERDRDAADETVAELDERVSVLRRQRMPLFAARPVAAAEPGVGQPHRRAGADDQPERAELGDHERKELRRA